MFELMAVGGSEFTLGFRLAGIRTVETDNPEESFRQLIKNPDVGIIITDEKSISKMRSANALKMLRLSEVLIPPMHHCILSQSNIPSAVIFESMTVNGPAFHTGPNPSKF